MPIPSPSKGEKSDEFMNRCMGNYVMNKEFPDQKQRAAVCYSQWRKTEKQETNNSNSMMMFNKNTNMWMIVPAAMETAPTTWNPTPGIPTPSKEEEQSSKKLEEVSKEPATEPEYSEEYQKGYDAGYEVAYPKGYQEAEAKFTHDKNDDVTSTGEGEKQEVAEEKKGEEESKAEEKKAEVTPYRSKYLFAKSEEKRGEEDSHDVSPDTNLKKK